MIVVLASAFLSTSGTAATYYVSAAGDDHNLGTNETLPFRSLQKAHDVTNPGDTVYVMNGLYTGCQDCIVLEITRSGTANSWIKYKAYPGHTPKIKLRRNWAGIRIFGASYIVIDGFEIEGPAAAITHKYAMQHAHAATSLTDGFGIAAREGDGRLSHHIIIQRNRVHHCGGAGIWAHMADYVIIQDNIVFANAWWSPNATSGISLQHPVDADGYASSEEYRNIIRRNITFANRQYVPWLQTGTITDGNGIIIDDTLHTQTHLPPYPGRIRVVNNLSYNNGGSGIHAYLSANIDIVNNTSYNNGLSEDLYGEIFANASRNVYIVNNVMYGRRGEAVTQNWQNEAVVFDYNVYFNTATIPVKGPHDIIADPKFVNIAGRDFRLLFSSPALNNGYFARSARQDFARVSRPQGSGVDRGAYESVLGNW